MLALLITVMAASLVSLYYFIGVSLIPALVRNYSTSAASIIRVVAAANPTSIFWVIEMWGYG